MSATHDHALATFLVRWRRPFFAGLYAVSPLEVLFGLTVLVWSIAWPADVPRWGGAILLLVLGVLGCRFSRRWLRATPVRARV